ncbi:hypothetical protein GGI05_005306 [Coemansia sp. RSA 2603]|nr:hypothetical protein GGI05_005306 [Coemansia sp. RSA 2603]
MCGADKKKGNCERGGSGWNYSSKSILASEDGDSRLAESLRLARGSRRGDLPLASTYACSACVTGKPSLRISSSAVAALGSLATAHLLASAANVAHCGVLPNARTASKYTKASS